MRIAAKSIGGGLIKSIADLYILSYDDLISLKFSPKQTQKILNAIEKSKSRPLYALIYGLGIPRCGESLSYTLARHFGNLSALANATVEELINVDGIGHNTAQGVRDFFDRNADVVERLNYIFTATVYP